MVSVYLLCRRELNVTDIECGLISQKVNKSIKFVLLFAQSSVYKVDFFTSDIGLFFIFGRRLSPKKSVGAPLPISWCLYVTSP